MEFCCGNVFVRRHVAAMTKDEVVIGHRHHFDHMTQILAGSMEISILKATEVNAFGDPLKAEIEHSIVIRAADDINFHLILKGRFHSLRSLEDGTRYQCVYAHQAPQALTAEPGEKAQEAYTRQDSDGTQWVRVDPKIVQVENGWTQAYR